MKLLKFCQYLQVVSQIKSIAIQRLKTLMKVKLMPNFKDKRFQFGVNYN